MTQDDLIELLKAHEWSDVEFKEARQAVPRSAYESVSAFANTAGGHLVFGVKKDGADFEVVGVIDVDNVQNSFLSTLRQPDKISATIHVKEDLHNIDGNDLLIFYVPEAARTEKPIFLNGDIRRAFIRKGGIDVRCSQEEVRRFINDASSDRYDGQVVEFNLDTCFDSSAISWYRNVYEHKPGNRTHAEKSDFEFLFELGLIKETSQGHKATKAAILLFGRDGSFRDLLPRITVDCQRYGGQHSELALQPRWMDRLVLDFNLIRSWQALTDWYQKLSETPFRVDPTTMQRMDMPPDYVAFREAAINILIHQDFSDQTRKPEICHFTDRTIFWNPGDAFASEVDLWEPGAKEVRNPAIVGAFRRIGLSENSGWGLRDVRTNWLQLGNVPPQITNDKARKTFQLTLIKELLLSEDQIMFQASLGVHLDENQAKSFAYACRNRGALTVMDVKAVTSLNGPDSRALLSQLVVQGLMEAQEEGVRYQIAAHLRDRFSPEQPSAGQENISTAQAEAEPANLSTAQAGQNTANLSTAQAQPLTQLSEMQWSIVVFCDTPRAMMELVEHLGVSNRGYFKKKHLDPLISGGVVSMTEPDSPRSPNQRYVLTDSGLRLKARRVSAADTLQKE
ncbi:RNA-binding domain-containing protein [Magnetofaba australis]|uniref:Putative AAA ATPase n=1 Tax=Magnetofaba australis IT-1 TaxID=1434232 RepID=A0A1Y2KAP0_9PROT|nr:RNA-binding domain-containing protein [Magnetofaba australis]OSM08493.1 putative AAA ATPase [Magnetofaba australis IT-1]